jgi:hypothetical protein
MPMVRVFKWYRNRNNIHTLELVINKTNVTSRCCWWVNYIRYTIIKLLESQCWNNWLRKDASWIVKNSPLGKNLNICSLQYCWGFSMNVRWASPSNKVDQMVIIFISIVAWLFRQTDGLDELKISKKV